MLIIIYNEKYVSFIAIIYFYFFVEYIMKAFLEG